MLECGDAKEFPRINRRRAIEIIQAAHFPSKIGACQHPSAAQATHAINLRQTTGHHELRPEVE